MGKRRWPLVIVAATLSIAAAALVIRSKPRSVPVEIPSHPNAPGRPVVVPVPEAPVSIDIQLEVARHFGLTESDRRADPTYRTYFLKNGGNRAKARLESYRKTYDLSEDQSARLLRTIEAEEEAHAQSEWARFEAIRRDVAARPAGDVKAAIDDAWKRHASGDPSVSRSVGIRRAIDRMSAWDRELASLLTVTQAEMFHEVKVKNADWMTDADRHGSVISDLADSFKARGLELTRTQSTSLVRVIKAHAQRHPAILGSLPFETNGFPVGLIDWSDASLLAEVAAVLPPDRYEVFASWGSR